jgi:hypothetical protein
MDPSRPPLVIGFELSETRKAIVADALAGASAVVYLTELDDAARAEALRNAGVLLTFNTAKELRPGEAKLLNGAANPVHDWWRGLHSVERAPRGCASGSQRRRLCRVDVSMLSPWRLPLPSV